MRTRAVLASVLALTLALLLGVGAPPSEFAAKESKWWILEPLMFPALSAGVILAALALISSCLVSRVRTGAALCLLSSLSTATGLVVAEGISARAALRFDAVCMILLAIPAVAAVSILGRIDGRRGFP